MNHVLSIYNLDLVKAVKETHAKIQNDERLEKERLEEEKQISLELERAEKKKDMLKKKEDELRSGEVNLEKEYDITTRMLKCAVSNG